MAPQKLRAPHCHGFQKSKSGFSGCHPKTCKNLERTCVILHQHFNAKLTGYWLWIAACTNSTCQTQHLMRPLEKVNGCTIQSKIGKRTSKSVFGNCSCQLIFTNFAHAFAILCKVFLILPVRNGLLPVATEPSSKVQVQFCNFSKSSCKEQQYWLKKNHIAACEIAWNGPCCCGKSSQMSNSIFTGGQNAFLTFQIAKHSHLHVACAQMFSF